MTDGEKSNVGSGSLARWRDDELWGKDKQSFLCIFPDNRDTSAGNHLWRRRRKASPRSLGWREHSLALGQSSCAPRHAALPRFLCLTFLLCDPAAVIVPAALSGGDGQWERDTGSEKWALRWEQWACCGGLHSRTTRSWPEPKAKLARLSHSGAPPPSAASDTTSFVSVWPYRFQVLLVLRIIVHTRVYGWTFCLWDMCSLSNSREPWVSPVVLRASLHVPA